MTVSAYVIYQCEVTDSLRYEQYRTRAAQSIANAGGRYLVRGGATRVLEGEPPLSRNVVLEFEGLDAVTAWYESADYQSVRTLRDGAAIVRMYVVEGFG